jgi:hypothetical protein
MDTADKELDLMTTVQRSLLFISLGLISTLAYATEPSRFPLFPREAAAPKVVVATATAGEYLPMFDECADPDVICMDPPPFWFNADIESVVYGEDVASKLQVATTSHYGMSDMIEIAGSEPSLIALLTDGKDYIMPRYAMAGLEKSKDGRWYLLVLSREPISWLPCSAWNLKQEVFAEDFPGGLDMDTEDVGSFRDSAPELFHPTTTGVAPRYAIDIARLSTHLTSLAPTTEQMRCE